MVNNGSRELSPSREVTAGGSTRSGIQTHARSDHNGCVAVRSPLPECCTNAIQIGLVWEIGCHNNLSSHEFRQRGMRSRSRLFSFFKRPRKTPPRSLPCCAGEGTTTLPWIGEVTGLAGAGGLPPPQAGPGPAFCRCLAAVAASIVKERRGSFLYGDPRDGYLGGAWIGCQGGKKSRFWTFWGLDFLRGSCSLGKLCVAAGFLWRSRGFRGCARVCGSGTGSSGRRSGVCGGGSGPSRRGSAPCGGGSESCRGGQVPSRCGKVAGGCGSEVGRRGTELCGGGKLMGGSRSTGFTGRSGMLRSRSGGSLTDDSPIRRGLAWGRPAFGLSFPLGAPASRRLKPEVCRRDAGAPSNALDEGKLVEAGGDHRRCPEGPGSRPPGSAT